MEPITSYEMSYAKIKPSRFKNPLIFLDEVWVQCYINIPYLRDYYWVSSYGRMYSGISGCIINPTVEPETGYCRITLMTNDGREVRRSIHRIVMESFYWFDGCENYDVNHKDGCKVNNWIGNLEWATTQENNIHALNTGLRKSGEDAYLAKYSKETVLRIADLLMLDMPYEEISMRIFGEYNPVYRHLISNIANKHCWKRDLKDYNFPSYRTHKQIFSDQIMDAIYQYHLQYPDIEVTDICRAFVLGFDLLDKKTKDKYKRAVSSLISNKAFDHIYSKYI